MSTMPDLTDPPSPPSRADSANFSARADAFLGWFVTAWTNLRASLAYIKEVADTVATSTATASNAASNAAASAVTATSKAAEVATNKDTVVTKAAEVATNKDTVVSKAAEVATNKDTVVSKAAEVATNKDTVVSKAAEVATNKDTVVSKAAEVATNKDVVVSKAAEAAASAVAAASISAQWLSGTSYAQGALVWSPIDYQSYRCVVAGVSTTDPSADTVNWKSATEATIATKFFPSRNANSLPSSDSEALKCTFIGGEKFVVSGMYLGYEDTKKVVLYSRASGDFNSLNSCDRPLLRAALLSPRDGYVIFLGGRDGASTVYKKVDLLNTTNNVWFSLPDLPKYSYAFASCVLKKTSGAGTDILLVSGKAGDDGIYEPPYTDKCYIYTQNATTGTYRAVANYPRAVSNAFAAGLNDGRALVGGGERASGEKTADTYIFSPYEISGVIDGKWEKVADFPLAVSHASATTLPDGRVFVIGGKFDSFTYSDSAYVYNPRKNSWTKVASHPEPISNPSCASDEDGKVLVLAAYKTYFHTYLQMV